MAWSDTPTLDVPAAARAWFPAPPAPAAAQHKPYWRPYHYALIAGELAALDAQLSGGQSQSGELAAALHRIVFAGSAEKSYQGALDADLHPLTAFATNVLAAEVTATLQGPDAALTGQQTIGGTLGATLRPVTAAATGQQLYTGTIGAALRQAAAQMQGSQTHTGILDADLTRLLLTATGQQTITGALAALLRKAVFAGVGNQAINGTLAAALRTALATITAVNAPSPTTTPYTANSTFDVAAARAAGYTHLDFIVLGGAGAGNCGGAGFVNGGGGGEGGFGTGTIALADYPSLTSLTVVVGAAVTGPSTAGTIVNGNASSVSGSGITTVTGAGGQGGKGQGTQQNGYGGGSQSLNGQTLTRGAGGTGNGGAGTAPGAGGAGGNGVLFGNGTKGGNGTRGEVRIRAYLV